MHSARISILLVLVVLLSVRSTAAQVPPLFNFQGRLSDDGGAPLDTVADLTFAIYEDEAGTSLLWSETHPSVTFAAGLFDVILGGMSPFPEELWSGPMRFLGVRIDDGPVSVPLTPIVSAPYAMRCGSAGFA